MNNDNLKILLSASVFWGMALASKMNTLLFLPVLLIAFFPRKLDMKAIFRCMLFYSGIISVYFLIGIPQNFKIFEVLSALSEVSSTGRSATFASMLQAVNYIKAESVTILIPIIVMSLLADKKNKFSIMSLTKGLIICCVVMGYYMFTDSIIRMEHYFFPLALVIIVFITCCTVMFVNHIKTRFQSNVILTHSMVLSCLILLLLWVIVFKPKNVIGSVTADNTASRPFAHVIMNEISKAQKEKKVVYVDPYVPYDRDLGNIVYSDSPTDNKVNLKKIDKLVFSVWYSERFAADSGCIEWEMKRPDWQEVREFYRRFKGKDSYIDVSGQKWLKDKALSNNLWTIWNKQ